MEYQKREDNYDEFKKYSKTVLKPQEVKQDSPVHGYAPSEQEEKESYAPVETMRLKNKGGMFAAGVNRNKEVTMALTSNAPGPMLRGDRSVVSMTSAKKLNETPDKIFTNSHDEKVSGVVYKDDLTKSPSAMIKTLKTEFEDRENVTIDTVAPFFSSKQDKEAKKEMEDYLRGLLERRQNGDEEYEVIKEELIRLNKRVALKELEEKRLVQNLTTATEKMKSKAEQLDSDYRRIYIEGILQSADAGAAQEEKDDNEEENKKTGGKAGKGVGKTPISNNEGR